MWLYIWAQTGLPNLQPWLDQNLKDPLRAAWADGCRTGAGVTAVVLIVLYLITNRPKQQ